MQKPIYLYDSGGVLSATITEVIDAELAERLDGTLTLYFASKVARLPVVTPETLLEFDGQYYRAMQIQSGISGGEFSLSVSCEQESITLVDYAIEEEFAFVGTANDALARLLDGTGITATAEYDGEIAVNVSGGNRRSVLLEIAALCGGEIEYHGHQIRIVNRRGTGAAYIAVLGSNTLTTHTATERVYGNLYKTYTVNPDTGEIVCSDYLSATLTGEAIYNNYKNYPVYKDITGKVHYINSVTKLASGSYRRTSQTITATRRTKELPSEEIHVSDIAVNTDPRSGTVSYDITISDPDKVSVGDDVELNFAPLRLTGSQRIVGKRYNPFNCTAVYLEVGEYSQTITSDYSNMQQIFLRKADAKMEFESYINSAEGIAAVKGALSGEFVTQDALTGFVTESQLNVAVEAYINGEEGIAKLTESLSGTFVTVREYGNNITLTATSQMFVQAEGSAGYSPSSITLTANTDGDLTFAWYKDGTLLSGKTAKTLTVYPADIEDSSATYKVVGTDKGGKTYSDQMSVAKLREGKEGADGASGYTMVLSNEYIEIPVTEKRFPKTARTYSCVVSVYSGTTKMTAVTGTPAAGQFRVSTPAGVTGITVSQSPAGTVKLTVSTGTAIGDINEFEFNVEIYGGVTLPAKITMTANMNDVAAGAYEVTSDIDSRIEQYISGEEGVAAITAAVSGKFVTSDDLGNYVQTSELNTSIKQYINGAEGTAAITSVVSGKYATKDEASSMIEQRVNGFGASLKLSVTNGEKSSTISLTGGGINLSGKVQFSGEVVFKSDLSTKGSTTINGDNITSGKISAEFIDVGELSTKRVLFVDDNYKYNIISSKVLSENNADVTVGLTNYIKGENFGQYLNLYGTQIYMIHTGYDLAAGDSDNYSLKFDMAKQRIISGSNNWSIGYFEDIDNNDQFGDAYFNYLYVERIYCDGRICMGDLGETYPCLRYYDGELRWYTGSSEYTTLA